MKNEKFIYKKIINLILLVLTLNFIYILIYTNLSSSNNLILAQISKPMCAMNNEQDNHKCNFYLNYLNNSKNFDYYLNRELKIKNKSSEIILIPEGYHSYHIKIANTDIKLDYLHVIKNAYHNDFAERIKIIKLQKKKLYSDHLGFIRDSISDFEKQISNFELSQLPLETVNELYKELIQAKKEKNNLDYQYQIFEKKITSSEQELRDLIVFKYINLKNKYTWSLLKNLIFLNILLFITILSLKIFFKARLGI